MEGEEIPEGWKKSKTKMLKKKAKPSAKDLRPMASAENSYKLYMSIIKEKIEDHICKNGIQKEAQAGFTKGRTIEDNIFVLRYCVEWNK
jgi:hypothetical protein